MLDSDCTSERMDSWSLTTSFESSAMNAVLRGLSSSECGSSLFCIINYNFSVIWLSMLASSGDNSSASMPVAGA